MTSYRSERLIPLLMGLLFFVPAALLGIGLRAYIVHANPTPTVTLSPIAASTYNVGDPATFTASATDSDASATVAYGLSGAPSGAAIDPASGNFSWDTTGTTPQAYTFSVTATGNTGGSDTQNVTLTLNAPPQTQVASSTQGTGGTATTTGGTIDTGNAIATTTVDNNLNISSTTPDAPGHTNSSTITASTTDVGTLDSSATSTADTGANDVIGGQGANSITTGSGIATSNVINEVNTNIFNSDGLLLFINQLFGGGIDLNDYDLSYFFAGGPGASPTTRTDTSTPQCTLLTCLNSSHLNVFNNNTATVNNSVLVRASTGANTASSTGDTNIQTGDAYAAANVVNLVNTNIINSSYLMLAFNNFGDLNDSVTLPGADFFSKLFGSGEATSSMNASTYTVANDNNVNFTGTTTADASSGDNQALEVATSTASSTVPTGSGTVNTGAAYSSSNTYNQLNSNNVGGTSVFMLFRVAGNWTGSVVGLPSGISETTVPDGKDELIELLSNGASSTPVTDWLQKYNSSSFLAAATDTASINNNVNVSADTGQNKASSDTGDASVSTGNAYASASVVNLVNTNIVGQNWIFALFNVFGNFNGDIVFGGSPLLTVAAQPSAATVAPGSDETYTFTVTNSGNADARDVILNASFDNTLLSFAPEDNATTTTTGESWDLGPIQKGQTLTLNFPAHVGTNFPANSAGKVVLTAAAINNNITSPATSNTADATIVVSWPGATNTSGGGGGAGSGGFYSSGATYLSAYSMDPKLSLAKTVSVATSSATTTANYTVEVYNDKSAGPLFSGVLTDTLQDPSGNPMYTRSWNLDTVNPGDDITLTYSVVYSATSTPGMYTNVAEVTGYKNYSTEAYGTLIRPVDATGTVMFANGSVTAGSSTPLGLVLGTSTSATPCSALLVNYILRGGSNNPADVFKLQAFLDGQGEQLMMSGTFDTSTVAAVMRFQTKYAADILKPWGLTQPTGSVYKTTLNKVDQLACTQSFTLTGDQQQQLAGFTKSVIKHTSVVPGSTVKPASHASIYSHTSANAIPAAASATVPSAQQGGKGGWLSNFLHAIRI